MKTPTEEMVSLFNAGSVSRDDLHEFTARQTAKDLHDYPIKKLPTIPQSLYEYVDFRKRKLKTREGVTSAALSEWFMNVQRTYTAIRHDISHLEWCEKILVNRNALEEAEKIKAHIRRHVGSVQDYDWSALRSASEILVLDQIELRKRD